MTASLATPTDRADLHRADIHRADLDRRADHGALDTLDTAIAELESRTAEFGVRRESDRRLLHDEVRALLDAGFGRLRLPREHGGVGASLTEAVERLIRIAAVDSNLAHVFRGHIGFVESLAVIGWTDPYSARWLPRLAAGDLVGNAQSERSAVAESGSTVTPDGDLALLNGVKYYTTGSIYADWIQLGAVDPERGEVLLIAPTDHPGTRSVDDWDGFGQPLTGSGTTTFVDVPVDPADYRSLDEEGVSDYVNGVFQLVLLAVTAGIGQAALRETVEFVRPRRRIFGYTGEALPRDSELTQAVVGGVSSQVDAARRLVLSVAADLDAALARAGASDDADHVGLRESALAVYRAQQVVPRLVLDAATELFEVGGASAVGRPLGLDRHWRNARTLFSHNPALQRKRAIGDRELNGEYSAWGRVQRRS